MYKLIINAGSSSLKFKLFNSHFKVEAKGIVERIGLKGSFFTFEIGRKEKTKAQKFADHEAALAKVIKLLDDSKFDIKLISKIGHRVVHGGEEFTVPVQVTSRNLKKLEKYNKLAPLHNPNNIAGIKSCLKLLPHAQNYAVFDTAFYSTIPDYAFYYPLPVKFYEEQGIRRYGFHGISHKYVALEAAKKLKKPLAKLNLITCHLGSGCSITAIKQGKAIDTSMGYTPLEGLMMSTRTGNIDPAILLFLIKQGHSAHNIEHLMNFESGWLGICGFKDMREILAAAGYNEGRYQPKQKFTPEQKKYSKLALQMFVFRIQKYIGAYTSILGKVNALVFTAGIGERSPIVRKLIIKDLPMKYKVLVIPTDEELMIAREI